MSTPALVVLGSSIRSVCRRLVAEAERAAGRTEAQLVVFSGWSANDRPSEAERMRTFWRGPSTVELVVEETASTTAQNAARTLPLLLERGVTEAVVICTPLHFFRARWIFRNVYGPHGVAVRFRIARIAPTPGALVWELGALTVVARQVRAARAELERV
ncbi:MAG TPA: YdcF family protein [Gaiellaceae bacterium]